MSCLLVPPAWGLGRLQHSLMWELNHWRLGFLAFRPAQANTFSTMDIPPG